MSAVSVLETAASLARQGVHQDKAKNYSEAARCYREAITGFTSIRCKSANTQVAAAIDEKIRQYRERLRKIDHYLLSKADLSKIFKSVVDYHVDNQLRHTASCDDIQKGVQLIEKAKRKDAKRCYLEAISLYEQGMSELLQVAISQQKIQPENSEKIRFKCLLIHDRVDEIRNSLETGKPVKDRGNFQMMENMSTKNRSGFDSCSASPEPLHSDNDETDNDNESRIMLMDEVRSNFSLAFQHSSSTSKLDDSHHSLYPNCEIKRSPSLNSDFGGSDDSCVKADFKSNVRADVKPDAIPLANMDQELNLSSASLDSINSINSINSVKSVNSVNSYSDKVRRMVGVKSATPSLASSTSSLNKHKYRSFHMSAENVLTAFANVTIEEQDRNVSEVTYICDTLKERPESRVDSASDSGISDPCSTFKRTTPSPSPLSTPPYSDDDSSFRVPPECLEIYVNDETSATLKAPLLPRPKSKSSSPQHSRSSLNSPTNSKILSRKGSRKQQSPSIEELTVLSSDTVDYAVGSKVQDAKPVGAKVKVKEEYFYGKPRTEYVPPRAFARRDDRDDDDDGINKGCYYFVSCLDAFWIL